MVNYTGRVQARDLAEALRALYSVHHPELAAAMGRMPEVVFVPADTTGTVSRGGGESVPIASKDAPLLAQLSRGKVNALGFKPEWFASPFSYTLGHGRVIVTPADDWYVVVIDYPDASEHVAEQVDVASFVTMFLQRVVEQ